MSVTQVGKQQTAKLPDGEAIPCCLDDVRVIPVGQPAAWFSFTREGDAVIVRPSTPLPRRCTIRPAALFRQDGGFHDVSTVMGWMAFARGTTQPQVYRPFTRDPKRHLRELFFPIEAMPEDIWPTSANRWSNHQAIAKRLLGTAEVSWGGLSARDVEELVKYVIFEEPLEGCILHALSQWTHQRGQCVIEIGSLCGRSGSILAMALRGAGSNSPFISVDPHAEQPHNIEHVRLALRQLGEEDRLVQIKQRSDDVARLLGHEIASLVFIDGDHSYQQVLADFRNYRDVLAPGGCMLFHDNGFGDHNGLPDLHPGVGRVIAEEVMAGPGFRPLLLAHTLFAFVKE